MKKAVSSLFIAVVTSLCVWGGALPLDDYIKVLALNPAAPQGSTLNDNLVAYWKMDESTGSTRNDSKNSNNLSDNNTVVSVSGKIVNAAQFASATGNYLSIADAPDLSMGSGVRFTIACWVNIQTKNGNGIWGKWEGEAGKREYRLFFTDVGGGNYQMSFQVRQLDDGGNAIVQATTFGNVPTSTWFFVACRYDGSVISISVNAGTADTTAFSLDVQDGTSPFYVGRAVVGDPSSDTTVDEMGVWKRALSDAEVTQLYNSGSGKTCCPFN